MRTNKMGLIGGMDYNLTMQYYKGINEQVNQKLGGNHNAELILYNVDFDSIKKLIDKNDWKEVAVYLSNISYELELFGVNFIVIAANLMNKIENVLQNKMDIDLIRLSDCVIQACQEKNIQNIGLIGKRETIQKEFLKSSLEEANLTVQIPTQYDQQTEIDRIILEELSQGIVNSASREYYLNIIKQMIIDKKIKGIILANPELELFMSQQELNIPIINAFQVHIEQITNYYLDNKKLLIKRKTRNW